MIGAPNGRGDSAGGWITTRLHGAIDIGSLAPRLAAVLALPRIRRGQAPLDRDQGPEKVKLMSGLPKAFNAVRDALQVPLSPGDGFDQGWLENGVLALKWSTIGVV